MNDDVNGTGPLSGWVIAQVQGLTVIGCMTLGRDKLRPVFELKPQMQMGREGVQIQHVAVPVWLLGVREMDLPHGAVVEPCENFGRGQRVALHRSVQMAEAMGAAIRAQDSGVVLAPAGSIPGRGR
jgi:hypothetical protein